MTTGDLISRTTGITGTRRLGGRRASPAAAVAAAVVLAASLSGCASGGSAPLSIHCSGRSLPAPDASENFPDGPVSTPTVTAVPGVPRATGAPTGLEPDVLDPGDPRYGYLAQGWQVSYVSGAGGRPAWSLTLRAPSGMPRSDPQLTLVPYDGYAVAHGGAQQQYLTAVSSTGRAGPECTVPPGATQDEPVDLLPHAGVLVLANPVGTPRGRGEYSLEGYSTATGARLWSVPSGTSFANGPVEYLVGGDTAYVLEGDTPKIAAYDARTGQQLWITSVPEAVAGSGGPLAVIEGRFYVTVNRKHSSQLLALNDTNGKILWERSLPLVRAFADLAVSQAGSGQVVLSDLDTSGLYLLDAGTGATLAARVAPAGFTQSSWPPVICHLGGRLAVAVPADGQIDVLSADPAYDRAIPIPSGGTVSVAVTDTLAYVRAPDPGAPVYGYDLATGELAWTLPEPASPADAVLYAFDGGFSLLGGSSPRYR
jgi:outer membrane protein assembly factor BamB